MNGRFQIALIFLVLTSYSVFAAGKRDIRGLSPGMTFDEVHKATPKGWTCEGKPWVTTTDNMIIRCEEGDLTMGLIQLHFSPNLPGKPLTRIRYTFVSFDPGPNILDSISQQYGATPLPSPHREAPRWDLGDGYELSLDFGAPPEAQYHTLNLRSITLEQNGIAARKTQELQQHPMPKF